MALMTETPEDAKSAASLRGKVRGSAKTKFGHLLGLVLKTPAVPSFWFPSVLRDLTSISESTMGVPSAQASNALLYLTYGAFLQVWRKIAFKNARLTGAGSRDATSHGGSDTSPKTSGCRATKHRRVRIPTTPALLGPVLRSRIAPVVVEHM